MAEQDFWQSILEYCGDVQAPIPRLESVPRNSELIDISPFSEDLNIVDDIFDTKDLLDPCESIPSLGECSDITDQASCTLSKPLSLQSNPPEWDISNWSIIPAASMASEIMNPTNVEFPQEDQKMAADVKQNTELSWNDKLPEIEISSPHRLPGSFFSFSSLQTHPDHLTGTLSLFNPGSSNICADVKPKVQIADDQHGGYCSPVYISTDELTPDQLCGLADMHVEALQSKQSYENKQLAICGDLVCNFDCGVETTAAMSSDESIGTSHHNSCTPNHMPGEAMEYTFPPFYNLPAMAETPNAVYVNSSPSVISDDPNYINTSWNRLNRKTTISAPSRAGSHQRGSTDRITDITLSELSNYFNMPITQAAKELKVGLTVLKKRCREFGIPRWPHRKMKSLESLIHNIQELGKNNGGLSNARLRNAVQILEEQKRLMEEMPGIELAERTKRLRQACFKASYKKRRQMAMESANLAGSEGSNSSAPATQASLPF